MTKNAKELRKNIENGTAEVVKTEGKHIYLYDIKRKGVNRHKNKDNKPLTFNI